MNMMRIFYIGLSGAGHDVLINGVWKMTLADFNLRRAALFATRSILCVNSDGISPALTRKYLGEKVAENLQSLQGYDPSEFTFANGVFCDVKEKLCRDDCYFRCGW